MAADLAELFQLSGFRLTQPRKAVLAVLQSQGEHLSPAEVLVRGREIYPALGRATVYRTLATLTDLGMSRPIYLGARGSRVACVEGGHHHLVCLECGAAIHFDDCLLEGQEIELGRRTGFVIKSHLLEVYGVCRQCADRLAKDGAHSDPQ